LPLALGIMVILLGVQIYSLYSQRLGLLGKADKVSAAHAALKAENEKLIADMDYFSKEANLLKEFKSLFNYRSPGEKMIIIVPEEQN